jgi:hypothetical protein
MFDSDESETDDDAVLVDSELEKAKAACTAALRRIRRIQRVVTAVTLIASAVMYSLLVYVMILLIIFLRRSI